ncbi:alpha/beta hydrolase [Aeromonas jandaei]|jgi:predicted alpha/beta hydrolase family esterase|uniref:Alpha/beta hydrolase n=1 Tax=Aeromonas jandaei TaxID=650 RepID=A0ABD7EKC0_AERJA|nr:MULTISPECIES: alpha/beta hydrolase [Aeromonas]MBL0546481.1 alpha/beta hydrolase [Aeromonas jandaei]MBL0599033.1 alpha/beta hydrolase [Aeromonas jandaei]MBL0610910.1 alpha/beta hydrolase [Aeromonas jandaei]MBM0491958.1 alpha/beta hydrolase [Aeromonas jandaei]MBM0570196.1 alpha/beta hydrolase [Aeromonas jandaei]
MNKILLVPGLHNSGPDHWQSRWHEHFPYWQRMTGLPWEKPDLTVWSAKLASKLRSRRSRVHLVAHSFGALTAIAAARLQPEKVASLFLVAPADPARFGIVDERLEGPLQVSAQLVASRNDPWMSFERAEYWSRQWQVPLFDAGNAGHINAQSGHGDWHQGLELLGSLYRRAELVVAPQAASAIRTVVVSAIGP